MVRLFIFLAAVQLVLFVLALISSLSAERLHIRTLPRVIWVLLIVIVPLLGPIAYFIWGRPLQAPSEDHLVRRRPRPASPDDDPRFLRTIDPEQSRRDRELLAQWEKELREEE